MCHLSGQRTRGPNELAAAIGDAEADAVDFDFVVVRGRGSLVPNRRLLLDLKVFAEPGLFLQIALLAALLSALLYIFGSLLGHLIIDGRVDQLHMPVALDNPSRCLIGVRRRSAVCSSSVGRGSDIGGSVTGSVVVQDQSAIEHLATAATRSAIWGATVGCPTATSTTATLTGISDSVPAVASCWFQGFTVVSGRLIVLVLLLLLLLVDVDPSCGEHVCQGRRRWCLVVCGLPARAAIFACNSLSSDMLSVSTVAAGRGASRHEQGGLDELCAQRRGRLCDKREEDGRRELILGLTRARSEVSDARDRFSPTE